MPLTKKGALLITNDIDRIATVIAESHDALGIPKKVATGFSQWCDRMSDRIEQTAGIDPQNKEARAELLKQALSGQQDHKTDYPFDEGKTHDAEEIGEEKPGRQEGDADESYMQGEFTQQENRELRDKQEAGQVPNVDQAPRPPKPGVQASLDGLTEAIKNGSFNDEAAAKVAEALNLATDIAKSAGKDEDEETGKEASYSHGYKLDA